MSQLFKNYGQYSDDSNYKYPSQKKIPDNTTPHLIMKPYYDEVIVLGADNTHCFAIPHRREEFSDLRIVYNQGTETKLIKEYHVVYGTNNVVEKETFETQELGSSNDQDIGTEELSTSEQILAELDDMFGTPMAEEDIPEPSPLISESGTVHWDFPGNSKFWKSLISFDVNAEETKNFNGYNQDVNVQVFVTLRSGHFKSQLTFSLNNMTTEEYLAYIDRQTFKGVENPLEGDVDYEFFEEDDPFIPDGGPARYDVSPIYKIKIVRKLQEGEISNE